MEEFISVTSKFKLDVEEALKSGLYASGTTGCGKSDLGMYWADALIKSGSIVFVFDPSQDWISRYPIDYIVKFRNNSTFGSIANSLPNIKIRNAILDTSTLTVLEMQELADRFSWLLFQHQAQKTMEERRQIFIIFEEAQIMLPQGSMSAKRVQNIVRLMTVGRNYKIRMGVITQFAAMVDKSALRYMRQRWFGWTDEPNDIQFLSKIVGKETAESLQTLKSGEFYYYAPTKSTLEKIAIEPYKSS